jgi:hypothetical protein
MIENDKWVKYKGCATALAFGYHGPTYKLGCTRNRAGYKIYSLAGKKEGWKRFPIGGGTDLAVDAAGDPWVINANHTVFRWDSIVERWVAMGVRDAHGIAAGAEGDVYVLAGSDGSGFRILRWEGAKKWYAMPGMGATTISIGKFGRPYITDHAGNAWWSKCVGTENPLTLTDKNYELLLKNLPKAKLQAVD